MTKLVLANIDYRNHMTDEGEQLQRGLEAAGWTLAGAGFGDGCRDVPTLMERYEPDVVLVQDKRDWDPFSAGAFRKDVGFTRINTLAAYPDVFKIAICKDAGTIPEYHRRHAEEIAADAVLIYYHEQSVLAASPWLRSYRLIRTYHSIDAASFALNWVFAEPRRRAILSGAMSAGVYPLRWRLAAHAESLGADVLAHPGYHNRGCRTPDYLDRLRRYRVSLATASIYGFALRKIVEALAMGCIPLTNLPAVDRLPDIDGALMRIPPQATMADWHQAIDEAEECWHLPIQRAWAQCALDAYDYRAVGRRLDAAIEAAREKACV